MRAWQHTTFTTYMGALLACAVAFSLGLHTVELTHHTHPGDHVHQQGQSSDELVLLDEYMHGTEKKSFLFLLASFLLLCLSVLPQFFILRGSHICFRRTVHYFSQQFSYLILFFRKGILHPKYY